MTVIGGFGARRATGNELGVSRKNQQRGQLHRHFVHFANLESAQIELVEFAKLRQTGDSDAQRRFWRIVFSQIRAVCRYKKSALLGFLLA